MKSDGAPKRISFNFDDAVHIYEWLIMYWHKVPMSELHDRLEDCAMCSLLEKRLAKFIGPAMVRAVKKAVRENP